MLRDRAILLLALGETFIWAALLYIFPATLIRWETDLAWSRAEITLAITIAILASALAAPAMGKVIDRGHGAALMGGTAVLGGVCLIGLSQIDAIWQFYLLWLVIGICMAGCLYEPCFAIVTRARGATAKRAITFITLIAGFAGTVSFPVTYYLAEAMGWRMAFIVIGLAVMFVVAPMLWLGANLLGKAATTKSPSRHKPRVAREMLTKPAFWGLGLGFALLALTHGATLHHLLPLLGERGVSPELAVLAAASIGPMQVVGRLFMLGTDRMFSHHGFGLMAFGILAIAIVVLWASGARLVGIGLSVAFFGAAWGMVSILRPILARDILGEEDFGAKSGMLALFFLATSAGSAYFGAWVWDIAGYDTMLVVLIVFAALGAVFFEFAHRRSSRAHS